MSAFTINTITIQGINIIAKLIAGSTLEFTKIELGDGQLQGINPQSVTALTNTVVTLPITAVSAADGTATVTGVFTNKDITTGFFYRELGLFAKDPETGEEKLYCYGNAENNAEWIPPSGTETVVEKKIKINTICGNATKVTATLASGIYVTKETVEQEIDNHNKDLGAHAVLFANVEYYVATNGNDNNIGTEDNPFKTVQHAINSIPKGTPKATIIIATGTYAENVLAEYYRGVLSIEAAASAVVNISSIVANDCGLLILKGITITNNSINQGCIYLAYTNGDIVDCIIKGNATTKPLAGIYCAGCTCTVNRCTINNCQNAVLSNDSIVSVKTTTGANNNAAYYGHAGYIGIQDDCNIGYTSNERISYNGAIICDQVTGRSITAGVADSTTDATDTSKKIVTAEFIKKANGWSFPSSNYVVIPLGPYVAPANGYIFISGTSNATGNCFVAIQNVTNNLKVINSAYITGCARYCYLPVKKGETVSTVYNCMSGVLAVFYYAQGEVE